MIHTLCGRHRPRPPASPSMSTSEPPTLQAAPLRLSDLRISGCARNLSRSLRSVCSCGAWGCLSIAAIVTSKTEIQKTQEPSRMHFTGGQRGNHDPTSGGHWKRHPTLMREGERKKKQIMLSCSYESHSDLRVPQGTPMGPRTPL